MRAQVLGSLQLTRCTWTVFLDPGSDPGPSQGKGESEQLKILSLLLQYIFLKPTKNNPPPPKLEQNE